MVWVRVAAVLVMVLFALFSVIFLSSFAFFFKRAKAEKMTTRARSAWPAGPEEISTRLCPLQKESKKEENEDEERQANGHQQHQHPNDQAHQTTHHHR